MTVQVTRFSVSQARSNRATLVLRTTDSTYAIEINGWHSEISCLIGEHTGVKEEIVGSIYTVEPDGKIKSAWAEIRAELDHAAEGDLTYASLRATQLQGKKMKIFKPGRLGKREGIVLTEPVVEAFWTLATMEELLRRFGPMGTNVRVWR